MATTITLEASATLRTSEEIRARLLESFAEQDAVQLDASAVAEIDLSFLQLVEAARTHAARAGKTIRLTAPANPALRAQLERAGLLAEGASEARNFWCHGDPNQ